MNILLTTVCNDKYLPGLLVFLQSFYRHHPNWDYPFKVYYRDDMSTDSIKKIKAIHPKIIFEEVIDPIFIGKYAQYMCLLPFKETTFDKVVFLDCDTLCLGSMDGLLNTQKDFAACIDYEVKFPRKKHLSRIPYLMRPVIYHNTGVFVVQGKLLSISFYEKLKSHINKNFNERDYSKNKLWDQDIINMCLKYYPTEVLPFTYNARKNLFKGGQDPHKYQTKLIHYTGGAKPWYTPGSGFLPLDGKYLRYKHLHQLWHQERKLFSTMHGYDPMNIES